MKTIIPVLLVFAAIDLFLSNPRDEQEYNLINQLQNKSIEELQLSLHEALLLEKYEYACILRDLINLKKDEK